MVCKLLKWSQVHDQSKRKIFFYKAPPPRLPKRIKQQFWKFWIIKKAFFEKNTALNQKSEGNRPTPPQNNQKTLPYWLSHVILIHFNQVTAIFFKMSDSGDNSDVEKGACTIFCAVRACARPQAFVIKTADQCKHLLKILWKSD